MLPSRQVEIALYKSSGREHGRGLGELAHVIARTPNRFLCKYIVPAVKNVFADLLKLAVTEIEDVFKGRKNFKTTPKVWEDKL